ncbi:uncharacterized protein LOC104908334 [Beta vulgaris subsp. vulgaris]|uniref:uncharacterized protein LOC104908334 n=1 Tax=Beta vulgaris subsp. vulgaris TaxID=3555 RepID=UPI0020366FD0|nr:uncharacterized protein LOC104908334 [Beta vulgaris subsp. vulgaris]
MAIDNLPNATTTSDESRLSGAYIRTLVKQLTTSKSLKNDGDIVVDYTQSLMPSKKCDKLGMAKPSNAQQQQQNAQGHKKQVRRRLHTTRPYQERLLNMAEARKEIVTALKFHRAAMKQANERRQQPLDDARKVKNEPCLSPFAPSTNSVQVENFCYYPSYNNSSSIPYPNLGISSSHLNVPPPFYDSLNNIPLPNQTLGLNLNLQAFTNLDTNFCNSINTTHNNNNNSSSSSSKYNSCSSSMSPSSSSSSTPRELSVAVTGVAEGVGPTSNGMGAMDMHPALDEEEMAEMRSIGEQHQIEWDDTLNLVKSAWWLKYLKTVDFGKEMKGSYDEYGNNYYHGPYEEFMEFPPWLNANNDESFLQQHLDDSCSEDTTLPWMDIGDIDGMDDEWLS